MSDEELIQGCIKGKDAFQFEVYKRYSPKMFGVCLRYCASREEAEDVLQDGFIKVFSKIDKIVLKEGQSYNKDSFEHQILQIFRNKEADHSKVRSKIYVENLEGTLYKLTDIGFDNNITIAIERCGKFNLKLSEVLQIIL